MKSHTRLAFLSWKIEVGSGKWIVFCTIFVPIFRHASLHHITTDIHSIFRDERHFLAQFSHNIHPHFLHNIRPNFLAQFSHRVPSAFRTMSPPLSAPFPLCSPHSLSSAFRTVSPLLSAPFPLCSPHSLSSAFRTVSPPLFAPCPLHFSHRVPSALRTTSLTRIPAS